MSINIFQSTDREINWNNAILCAELSDEKREVNVILRLIYNAIARNEYIFYVSENFQKYINLDSQSIEHSGVKFFKKRNLLKLFDKINFIIFPCEQEKFSNLKYSEFIDSILLSVIPIVHKSTWMARELEKYALDILIVDFEYIDLRKHLDMICKNKIVIGLKFNIMKNDYLIYLNNSPYVNFINSISQNNVIASRVSGVSILGQMQPSLTNSFSSARPSYFTEVVFSEAFESLGIRQKNFNTKHARNIVQLLFLTLSALKKIITSRNDLFIVWQGYGAYAIWIAGLMGIKTRFIINTYKIPEGGKQSFLKIINDKVLEKLIKNSEGVITISRTQAVRLKLFSCKKVAWIPFASDASWWTPKIPDRAILGNHGINFHNFILVMGDVDRDENVTLRALGKFNIPILRVTRDKKTAELSRKAFADEKVTNGEVYRNVSYELLRELYRAAKVVVVPAKGYLHPAGMTSMTEAMCCGRPVVIPSGLATDGYVNDGYNAFVLDEWEETKISNIIESIYRTDIGEYVGSNGRKTVDEFLNFKASSIAFSNFLSS
jgi:glycosyltransferase involved in cell wall biosynthesis